jgi:hypothetical protein
MKDADSVLPSRAAVAFEFVAASFSWAPLTCRSQPIRFAISLQRFVSPGEIGILRSGGDASVSIFGGKFQEAHSIQEMFSTER